MKDILLLHAQRYPAMKAEDGVKLCYQSEFGGGHLAPSREACEEAIREERMQAPRLAPDCGLLEEIGGGLLRLHLNAHGAGSLHTETIAGLFLAVAEKERGTKEGFFEKVALLRQLTRQGSMPFSLEALEAFWQAYEKAGHPLCRHSETFRQTYHPAYRLAGAQAQAYLPLLHKIDQRLREKDSLLLAIDGPSGAGKSSLAAWLEKVYGDCALFHMDDFFLPQEKKTPERLAIPGGNVDWERFLKEVLTPLQRGESFSYRPFNCATGMLDGPVYATPRRLNVIEGVYSHHAALRDAYDMKVFLAVNRQEQSGRILQRNGPQMHARFMEEWIPLEDLYFREMQPMEKAGLVLGR